MSFSRGPKEPAPQIETNVWSCKSEDCQGWMRESFSFNKTPACPLCQSEMEQQVRMLPELE
ncbi:cold-shock protein [Virgibacillus sp. W0430]|uniref:cold-shock protein n=1 Tax=Virgibacillus sp. W0430 TaxID=3391580 RepID=UPI003F45EDD4